MFGLHQTLSSSRGPGRPVAGTECLVQPKPKPRALFLKPHTQCPDKPLLKKIVYERKYPRRTSLQYSSHCYIILQPLALNIVQIYLKGKKESNLIQIIAFPTYLPVVCNQSGGQIQWLQM